MELKPGKLGRVLDVLFVLGLTAGLLILVMLLVQAAQASQPSIWVDSVGGAAPPNASGSPEAMSPVSALATCHTNGAASTTIQWASNGIVLPAGNACDTTNDNCGILFLNTAAGRQYSEILAVTANTVVVEDSFNIALASAVDCAVGGRITNVSPQLALDMKGNHGAATHGTAAGGWQIELVNAGAHYVFSATRTFSGTGGGGAGIYGVLNAGVRPTIECSFTGGTCLALSGTDLVNVVLQNTNPNKAGTVGLTMTATGIVVRNSIIGDVDPTLAWETGAQRTANHNGFWGNLFIGNEVGLQVTGISDQGHEIFANVFQENGIGVQASAQNKPWVIGNIFWNNTTGLQLDNTNFQGVNSVLLNTFDSNTTAVDILAEESIHSLVFGSNLITNNTTGVAYSGAARNIAREAGFIDYNCYGTGGAANGSNISGFVLGPHVISINPLYADEVTGDFTPGVTNFTITAWPPGVSQVYPGTTTPSSIACGAIQPAAGGGFSNVGI